MLPLLSRYFSQVKLFHLCLFNLLITTAYALASGSQPLTFFPDEKEYVLLADKALQGDFNFDIGRFIRSPLYPLFLAAAKLFFGGAWLHAVLVIHALFQALACAGLYFLAKELFNRQTAVISALLFSIFIPCFFYIKAISSETIFQANYIWLLYFFLVSLKRERIFYTLITGILFSLAYLNRSQIGLFAPIMVSGYLFSARFTVGKRIVRVALFTLIAVTATLPWGLTNLRLHNLFITSSNGGTWVFIAGNSNTGYAQFIEDIDIHSKRYKEVQMLEPSLAREMGDTAIWSKSVMERQAAFSAYGRKWVKENPGKFLHIKTKLAALFFVPGLMKKHHPFTKWLMSFLVALPFYVLAYIGMAIAFRQDWRNHLWFAGYLLTIFILMVVFVFSSRFRTYGIEALYLMYAAVPLALLAQKIQKPEPPGVSYFFSLNGRSTSTGPGSKRRSENLERRFPTTASATLQVMLH